MSTILVTGAAGFIGFHVCQKLLSLGDTVVGMDNLNDYYAISLKHDRLAELQKHINSSKFTFSRLDLCDQEGLLDFARKHNVTRIVHLAAQAGVRYSIENPHAYLQSNVIGFMNILDVAQTLNVEHLVYASSSSVYGANHQVPFCTTDQVDRPVSMYAATKKSNELMAHVYSHLYGLPTTGLRFFTVYGPWGRPDMSPMLFADAMVAGKPIKVFNHGEHWRDFTYVDDIVDGIVRTLERPPTRQKKTDKDSVPYKIYNIGANNPVHLLSFIETIEQQLGIKAEKQMLPMQHGDVERTFANVDDLVADTGYAPNTSLADGVAKFIEWYRDYKEVPYD
jgi:UDP-glucuronate 4-epimerase